MKFEDHCKECINKLGKPYEEVHRWLDALAGQSPWGMKHRKFRHHEEGLNIIEEMFGKEARRAGYLHIVSDLKMDQWDESMPFPKNEKDYVEMGLF